MHTATAPKKSAKSTTAPKHNASSGSGRAALNGKPTAHAATVAASLALLDVQQYAPRPAPAAPTCNQQQEVKPVAKVSANAPTQVTAEYLHRAGASSFFFSAAQKIFRDQISAQTIQDYIEELVVCCKANHDPLEFFLVEQIALLRFTGALLHGVTVNSKGEQNQTLLNSAACQTNAEMRRAIMTLRDYRNDNGLSRSKPSDKTVKSESSSAEKPQQE